MSCLLIFLFVDIFVDIALFCCSNNFSTLMSCCILFLEYSHLNVSEKSMFRLKNILKPFFHKYDCDGNENLDKHELSAVFVDLGTVGDINILLIRKQIQIFFFFLVTCIYCGRHFLFFQVKNCR